MGAALGILSFLGPIIAQIIAGRQQARIGEQTNEALYGNGLDPSDPNYVPGQFNTALDARRDELRARETEARGITDTQRALLGETATNLRGALDSSAATQRRLLLGLGDTERLNIRDQVTSLATGGLQDLTSRGLRGTTLAQGVRQGATRTGLRAEGALNESIRQQQLGVEQNIGNQRIGIEQNLGNQALGIERGFQEFLGNQSPLSLDPSLLFMLAPR